MIQRSKTTLELSSALGNQVSRRSLVRAAIGAGLAVPVMSSLLAACADESDADGESVDADDDSAAVDEPDDSGDEEEEVDEDEEQDDDASDSSTVEGGHINVAWDSPPPHFNPLTAVSPMQRWVFVTVMSPLVVPNPEAQEFEPELAESVEIDPDGSTYTYTLHPEARWHDGEPVTTADVAMTYRLALDPATESRLTGRFSLIRGSEDFTAGDADEVAGIVVEDDRIITFEMEFPNGLFTAEVAELPILPEHILGDVDPVDLPQHDFFFRDVVGCGPFKFVRHEPDQLVEVEANPDFYRGAPNLSGMTFHIIESSDTIEIAMGRGEIDMPIFDGGSAEFSLYERFIEEEGFRIDSTSGTTLIGYGWNHRVEDLQDPRIRQAFLHAIDRERIVEAFNGNNGSIFNSFMVHPWYQEEEWADQYPFDPDRARELLEEAGWDSSRTVNVNVITLADEESRAMVAAEQQMLAEVGFNIEFQEMEAPVWVENFYDNYDFELVRVTFGTFADPDGFLNFHMHTGSANAFGYANEELDELIDAGRREVDQDARAEIYQEINEEMLETLPVTPIYLQDQWYVRNERWYVPQLDQFPKVSSLTELEARPVLIRHSDVWHYRPETWEVRE